MKSPEFQRWKPRFSSSIQVVSRLLSPLLEGRPRSDRRRDDRGPPEHRRVDRPTDGRTDGRTDGLPPRIEQIETRNSSNCSNCRLPSPPSLRPPIFLPASLALSPGALCSCSINSCSFSGFLVAFFHTSFSLPLYILCIWTRACCQRRSAFPDPIPIREAREARPPFKHLKILRKS